MLTNDQISTAIYNAKYALALSVNGDLTLMYGACQPEQWVINMCNYAVIRGLQYQQQRQDFSSTLTYSLYNKVLKVAGFVIVPTIDPNFQNQQITVTSNVVFQPLFIRKTQTDLIEDGVGTGNWYLPFLDNNGNPILNRVPVFILAGGRPISPEGYDPNFTPARIYGFANNSPQSITITVI